MVERLDIGSLLAELKALESVIYELLQTIFPRDFDTHPPTITEAVSQTPPTMTEAVSQTPPTMTEAVSQTPPTITKAVSEAPPTKAVFKAPPTTIEGASDAPPTMFTQPPLEEELLLEPEEVNATHSPAMGASWFPAKVEVGPTIILFEKYGK